MRKSFYEAAEQTLPKGTDLSFQELIQDKQRTRTYSKRAIVLIVAMMLIFSAAGAAALMLTAADVRRKWEEDKGAMSGWTLEEKAAFAQEAQAVEPIWENAPYRTAKDGEIGKETAKRIAVNALILKFGLSEAEMAGWSYQEALTYLDPDYPEDGCYYEFTWINLTDSAAHPGGDVYAVQVDPGTGEVLTVQGMDDLVG